MNEKNKYIYLGRIDTPEQLRRLPVSELKVYCAELREFIIEQVSLNPGHLGSSLGALELAVAIHYVYDTPNDKLVWDVGHQAYAHKIITGRRDSFHTNRKYGGISGFPRRVESEYDAFGVGHSSTSISAALGMSIAASLLGKEKEHTIAVIGDGSIGCGLAFEGLNNAGASGRDMLVILNDNKMAIDPNVGALKEYLLELTTSEHYNKMKTGAWNALSCMPGFRKILQKIENGAKSIFLHQSNLFEAMNFRYFGPVDGNDVEALVRTLKDLKNISGPKLLHAITVKGKGYKPAEVNQTEWHAPGLFDFHTGEKIECKSDKLRYQDVFGHTLVELARRNERIVGITPAMPTGCSMNLLMEQMPDRAFDVGIAEGHAVVMAAGMAASGLVPFCNIYSSFMQRAVDNIIHDVALQGLEVVLPLDRAGIVGQDGATHHGLFDIPLLRSVPNVVIGAPSSAEMLRDMMYTASKGGYGGAFVIRYPRGGSFEAEGLLGSPMKEMELGKSRCVVHNPQARVVVLSLGSMVEHVNEAMKIVSDRMTGNSDIIAQAYGRLADNVDKEPVADNNISVEHHDLIFAKPLDVDLLDEICSRESTAYIVTVEDGMRAAGVGSAVLEYMSDKGYDNKRLIRLGVDDVFIEHGMPDELYQECGLDARSIAMVIGRCLKN